MDIILLERVENLGQMGQVVKVKPGYARNFLLPKKKALRATKENLAFFEKQRVHLEAVNLKRKGEAEQVAAKMTNVTIVVIRQAAETGVLYGSVTSRDVAEGLTAGGYKVDRAQVAIPQPIKTLGLSKVRVILHPEVSVVVTVNVARSAEEAALQAERGAAVTTAELIEEEEAAEAAAEAEATEGEAEEA